MGLCIKKTNAKIRLAAVLMIAIYLITTISVQAASFSTSWNFKSSNFKNLGTISSTKTVDGLTLIATSSKTMQVKSENVTVDGTSYTHALALGGSGSTSARAVKVPVYGKDNIKVTLKSSGSSTRTLVVADASGKQLGTISAGSSASTGSYYYTGGEGYVYLYSSGSGINIYKIQVDSVTDSSSSGSSSSSSGSSSSGSSSSSSTTVTNYASVSDGWYYLKNVHSQKYLQVANNSGYDGANVEQGSGSGVSGQKWYVTNVGNGYVTLKNGTGYMLDVPNGINEDGTNIQVWSANGLGPQMFKFVKTSEGYYGILTNASADTKCLDVYNWSTSNGGNICQWSYWGGNCQLWILESTSGSSGSGSSSSGSSSSGSSSSGKTIEVKNGGTSLETAIKSASKGTTIVINGTVKSGKISLPAGVNISGKNNATIDFSSTSGSSGKGITISGNGSTIENVVIKNAADNGIYVTGSNNTFKNVETCYNSDTGIQVSEGGANNKFYDCYSHHNMDTAGENADGFAVKLHSGEGNYFENCTASYNVDDGWDLYAAHGAVEFVNCTANYNGYCNGVYGDGNGFKLGGVDNKTDGVAAHLDPLNHKLTNCTAIGNYKTGFDRNNQNGVVTMIKCYAESNKKYNYSWPLTGSPSALGYTVTFGKAIIQDCTSVDGSNNIKGATLKGNCVGF